MVTSLVSFIGPRPDLPEHHGREPARSSRSGAARAHGAQMERIRAIADFTDGKFHSKEIDITYPLAWGREAIEARLASIRAAAVDAVRSGINILILTDRKVSRERVAIPGAPRHFGRAPVPRGRRAP